MRFEYYIKGKLAFLLSQTVVLLCFSFLLALLNVQTYAIMLFSFFILFITVIVIIVEYTNHNKYYKEVYDALYRMDKKHFIAHVIDEPDFGDGRVLYNVLHLATKSMNDEIAHYQILDEEYKEYIETWIHEVKIPISCISLLCENNKSEFSQSIMSEVGRIDAFVEQALFYARSTNLEKDYLIHTISLEDLIRQTIKKYSRQLIHAHGEIKLEALGVEIYSDSKWLDFILGQIISNSIKYRRTPFQLTFSAVEEHNRVLLNITDNGIGIPASDLPRIFDKGFTGENGRTFAKSTGIGLYLCQKLCTKMHLGIEAFSVEGSGTTIQIIFPKDKSLLIEN